MEFQDLPLFEHARRTSAPKTPEPQGPASRSPAPVADELAASIERMAKKATKAPLPELSQELPKDEHLTVSELTAKIRGTLEPAFPQVWVVGEVSNYRPAASGHAYFSLKDAQSNIATAFFGWGAKSRSNKKYAFDLKDGLQVLCRGKITVYPPRGSYQLTLDHIEPLGAGALQLAFEQLKEKLQAEGLFSPARKRPLPKYPARIAVVTSPSGAAIRDMLNIMARRAPHVRVTVIPALVQGDEAAGQIIRGLEWANLHSLGDIVVLARGGGSIEDLWSFNDERLARAIAASRLPVVSAVGHEIDFTISDFVSDLRAPTPSAAAEIVTTQWVECRRALQQGSERMVLALSRNVAQRKQLLTHLGARVVSPRDRLREQAQRCDELAQRGDRAVRARLERGRARLEQAAGRLDALSPLKVLERGYALVANRDDGALVRAAADLRSGQALRLRFADGERDVSVLE